MRKTITILLYIFVVGAAFGQSALLDDFGQIEDSYSRDYFKEIEKYLLPTGYLVDTKTLSMKIVTELVSELGKKENYKDYSQCVFDGNYSIIQTNEDEGLFEIQVPRDPSFSESAKRLWKLTANIIIGVNDDHLKSYTLIHEQSIGKFIIHDDYLQYVSVESSFGMNYTKVFLMVFDKHNLKRRVLDKIVYASGSFVDAVLLRWKWGANDITVEGMMVNETSKEIQQIKETINLTSASTG